ncbi:MAG: diguanylate cyclase with and sensor [Francisellaceae bacterium]|nr:diguanylate cyclase with and sensor [Francisellaceae bacterium]
MRTFIQFNKILNFIILTFCLIVLLGWVTKTQSFIQLFTTLKPMDFNSAISFSLLTGGVFLGNSFLKKYQKETILGFSLMVTLFVSLIFYQYLSNLDLSLDEVFIANWFKTHIITSEKMSYSVCLCFILSSLSLILIYNVANYAWSNFLIQLSLVNVLIFGVIGLITYFLKLETFYPFFKYAIMPFQSACNFILLSIIYWCLWYQKRWLTANTRTVTELLIDAINIAILLVVCLASGVSSFVNLIEQTKMAITNTLTESFENKKQLIEYAINEAKNSSYPLFNHVRNHLVSLDKDLNHEINPAQQQALKNYLEQFLSNTITGIQYNNNFNQTLITSGDFKLNTPVSIELDKYSRLLWQDLSILEIYYPLDINDKSKGKIIIQINLNILDKIIQENTFNQAEIILCSPYTSELMECFPTKNQPNMLGKIDRFINYSPSMHKALDGEKNITVLPNYQGKQSIAAFGPLQWRLGLVIAMHTETLYAPIKLALEKTFIFILTLWLSGMFLLRSQLMPIVRKLVHSELEATSSRFKLQEQEFRLRAIIDNIPEVIITINQNLAIESCNNKTIEMFGYTPEELKGKPIDTLIMPSKVEQHRNQLLNLLRNKLPLKTTTPWQESLGKKKNGEIFATETCVNLINLGDSLKLLGIVRDISERKENERVLKAINEKLTQGLEELNARHRENQIFTEFISILQSCLTIKESAFPIIQFCHQLLPLSSGILYMVNSNHCALELIEQWGNCEESIEMFYFNDCWAVRRGHSHCSANQQLGLICQHATHNNTRYSLCIPMMGQGEIIGLLYVEFPYITLKEIEQSSIDLCNRLAGHIALGLANVKLRQTLHNQSVLDPLTGLYNRRFFEEAFSRELALAKKNNNCLSLLMIDIDHFKHFNDTFGHDAGDFVLKSLSKLFCSFIKVPELICRLGGEEFVILQPNVSSKNALQIANILREEAKKLSMKYQDKILNIITLSIGIACFPEHATTPDTLLQLADKALYIAKNGGRDQVVLIG